LLVAGVTALRWISTSLVIAIGAFAMAGGLGVANEVIVVDRNAATGVAILGALLIAAGVVLRPSASASTDRPAIKKVRVLASTFVMGFGALLVAHDFVAPPAHSDAAAFEIALGALMLIAGLALRPGAQRTGGSQ
jgi:hypothetical protein